MENNAERIAHHLKTRLRISHLVMLDAIATEGSIHKAAYARGVSQPGITKSLRELEAVLGCVLFERSNSGLTATMVGRELIESARAILRDIDKTADQLVSVAHGYHGILRVGVIPYVSYEPLTSSATALTADRRIQFSFSPGTSTDIVGAVRERRLDCGIVRYLGTQDLSGLIFNDLYKQRAAIIYTATVGGRIEKFSDVWKRPEASWLLPPKETPTRIAIDLMFIAEGEKPPNADFECLDVRMMSRLLREDVNRITILPLDVAEDICADGKLEFLESNEEFNLPPICFVASEAKAGDPIVSAWRTAVKGAMRSRHGVKM